MKQYANPFTPVFGGKPEVFFGRSNVLARFEDALLNQGSETRALFITGSRGYGKTTLLEQLSVRATKAKRKVIDVGPDNPIGNIMRHLFAFYESTKTIEPEVEISVLGSGGKLHGGSISKTVRYDNDDFPFLFLQACEREFPAIFLSIDEIQKVSLEEISIICNTFQMASRKGYDVMLAVAGLPSSYSTVINHDGCTFLRRGSHEELGPLTFEEVRGAFHEALTGISGITLDEDALDALIELSKGHPYVMQLEGYYLVDSLNDAGIRGKHRITLGEVNGIRSRVISSYYSHAIRPLLDELPPAEVAYLKAMVQVLSEDRVAHTGDIAKSLGKKQNQLSTVRGRLLDKGIVFSVAQGQLVFAIPYLADYLLNHQEYGTSGLELVRKWKL